MAKILIIQSNTKSLHSTLARMFKYKHEDYGINIVPINANIINLLEKTDAKCIITDSCSRLSLSMDYTYDNNLRYSDKDCTKIKELLLKKGITLLKVEYNDYYGIIKKAMSIALPVDDILFVDKFSFTLIKVNVNSVEFLENIKNKSNFIKVDSEEHGNRMIQQFIRDRITNLTNDNNRYQKTIENNKKLIQELKERITG